MAAVIGWRPTTGRLGRPSGRPGGRWGVADSTRRFRLEGVSLALSGESPSAAAELVAWRSAEKYSLSMTNEAGAGRQARLDGAGTDLTGRSY